MKQYKNQQNNNKGWRTTCYKASNTSNAHVQKINFEFIRRFIEHVINFFKKEILYVVFIPLA